MWSPVQHVSCPGQNSVAEVMSKLKLELPYLVHYQRLGQLRNSLRFAS